jgi:hypothetical protein
MISLGMYHSVDTLIRGYPYLVILALRRVHVIFVALKYNFINEFRIIRLPQRLHKPFRRLLIINKLNNVNQFYIEYVGNTDDGQPILRASGGGFNTYV